VRQHMFAYEGVGAITLPRHRGYALGFMVTAFTFTGHVKLEPAAEICTGR
jgi:hypothetical protein